MARRLVRKRVAELDLADQVERIAREQPPAARRYLLAVERAFDRLLEMPEMGVRRTFRHPKLAGLPTDVAGPRLQELPHLPPGHSPVR